ncbi:DUF429 domain-containing protein [Brevibacillus dissolubilis]|uniref:DUF429 domain-containing protein n=1 Tax=Brevibacillus dissolubilis TaxID=1844116 RepID=UPI00159B9084|nr:DUF429 domain-containing protein [Brevibacillus dissolubilis]
MNPLFVGVDGCRAGWIAAALPAVPAVPVLPATVDTESVTPSTMVPTLTVFTSIEHLFMTYAESAALILIDMPIGLPDASLPVRECDNLARKLLDAKRKSSVFPVPSRPAVYAEAYGEANARNRETVGRGLSRQSWQITQKIREVDQFLHKYPEARGRLREAHPELCFHGLNGGHSMAHNKKTQDGYSERLRVLRSYVAEAENFIGEALSRYLRKDVARDDLVDALVLAVTAQAASTDCYRLQLVSVPADPPSDAHGNRMEIVYGIKG